ncbi:hypothetical protein [Porphyromonas macacae]|uniref:hypothetical protein n=1 Tax=Porphyromonas macacae TaxID=28115 RepID=UPI0013582F4D|nr:hypothetical protein [Porphyromonas macacae]
MNVSIFKHRTHKKQVLDGLDLTGSIVSPDAMGTHTTIIVEHIVDTSKKENALVST